MSELGNIKDSYGKQISIGVANTFGDTLLKSNVPSNMLIINAPVDSDKQDVGGSCVFATDINGEAIRLTYALQLGNGICADVDKAALQIDGSSICVDASNALYVNTQNIIDTQCVSNSNNTMYIDTQTLPTASKTAQGIVKADDNTIKIVNDSIYVETENLDKANSSQYGVITSDANTINISDNGIVSVVTNNLVKSSNTVKGIVKTDDTISVEDGLLSVAVDNLTKTSSSAFGVAKCDTTTIKSEDGLLSVNQDKMASASSNAFGIMQPDDVSLTIVNGLLTVKDYDTLVNNIAIMQEKVDKMKETISSLNTLIENGVTLNYTTPTIFEFICTGVTSKTLPYPTKNSSDITVQDDEENIPVQNVTAEFKINTNCPFTISIEYEENINPQVHLYNINYDDIQQYSGQEGLKKQFQSTEGKEKLIRFSFVCKNFADTRRSGEITTKIKFKVSYTKDTSVSKSAAYHIIRYNTHYNH